MATWAVQDEDFPAELYPGASPGWVAGCAAWLAGHPGRRAPFGQYGDMCEIYAIAVELAEACYLPAGGENSADPA